MNATSLKLLSIDQGYATKSRKAYKRVLIAEALEVIETGEFEGKPATEAEVALWAERKETV